MTETEHLLDKILFFDTTTSFFKIQFCTFHQHFRSVEQYKDDLCGGTSKIFCRTLINLSLYLVCASRLTQK